jgi:hypothetical protein
MVRLINLVVKNRLNMQDLSRLCILDKNLYFILKGGDRNMKKIIPVSITQLVGKSDFISKTEV